MRKTEVFVDTGIIFTFSLLLSLSIDQTVWNCFAKINPKGKRGLIIISHQILSKTVIQEGMFYKMDFIKASNNSYQLCLVP